VIDRGEYGASGSMVTAERSGEGKVFFFVNKKEAKKL
jgi:hypothetical protein